MGRVRESWIFYPEAGDLWLRLKHFFRFIGLPVNFKELGIENPDIDRLADSLHRNKGEFVGNYVKLTKQDSKEIYRLAL